MRIKSESQLRPPTEAQEAEVLVRWCHLNKIPIIHIPNEGKRSKAAGAALKRQGMMKGVADYFIPLSNKGEYFGVWIELKRLKPRGKISQEQENFLTMMRLNGYHAFWCFGADEAIMEIKCYLGME